MTSNPVALRQKLGGRWLTTDFKAGDVLSFSMGTVHASLDNHSKQIRPSTDSRYQLASEPVDERWVGPPPASHGAVSAKFERLHSRRGQVDKRLAAQRAPD